jgi:hypothetical protein
MARTEQFAPIWTEQTRAGVEGLYSAGQSYSQIAAQFGTTRNAIGSLIRRMGLVKNPVSQRVPETEAVRLARKEWAQFLYNKTRREKRAKLRASGGRLAPLPCTLRNAIAEPPRNLSFEEMNFRRFCAYPTHGPGERATFCGHELGFTKSGERSRYCQAHHNLSHGPTRASNRSKFTPQAAASL